MKGSLTACEAMPRERPRAGAQPLPGYHSSAPSPLMARYGDQGHPTPPATPWQTQQAWTQAQGLCSMCPPRSPPRCYF